MMKDLPSANEVYTILMQEQVHQEISKIAPDDSQEPIMAIELKRGSLRTTRTRTIKTLETRNIIVVCFVKDTLMIGVGSCIDILLISGITHGKKKKAKLMPHTRESIH